MEVNLSKTSYKLKWAIENSERPANITQEGELKKKYPRLQRPFIANPPDGNAVVDIDVKMHGLTEFVTKTLKQTQLSCNLTKQHKSGLKSLQQRKDTLHISVSDKCGEFVVSSSETYKRQIINHFLDNPEVYKWVPPTRTYRGNESQVKTLTDVTYRNQINNKRIMIENQCNMVWENICQRRNVPSKFRDLFLNHNTTLPTLYTLIKTHKIPPDSNLNDLKVNDLKVRPIVSCSGSPTEKIGILTSSIITPLLKYLPMHMSNIHEHLEKLKNMENKDLAGYSFYTADVSALFTNVNVDSCISDILDLAHTHWDEIVTHGLELIDLQELLDVGFRNAFFTFNGRLYWQVLGVFMGYCPSPTAAIIRLAKCEMNSIYIDPNYISYPVLSTYLRYVDDKCAVAKSKEEALSICQMIAERDSDHNIRWEVEFPQPENYLAFLDTEIRIDTTGRVHSR